MAEPDVCGARATFSIGGSAASGGGGAARPSASIGSALGITTRSSAFIASGGACSGATPGARPSVVLSTARRYGCGEGLSKSSTIVLRPHPSESASARTDTAPSGSFITPVASRPSVTFTVAGPRPTLPDAIPYPPR